MSLGPQMRYEYQPIFRKSAYGDYGIMVITRVCGTCNSGSIPDSHPNFKTPKKTLFIKVFLVQILRCYINYMLYKNLVIYLNSSIVSMNYVNGYC